MKPISLMCLFLPRIFNCHNLIGNIKLNRQGRPVQVSHFFCFLCLTQVFIQQVKYSILVLAMVNGRCNWPRGKVLGGSSVLNYMLYVRGNHKDYDIWESMGNPGWGRDQALYYFKKSEDNRNPYLARTMYHSQGNRNLKK